MVNGSRAVKAVKMGCLMGIRGAVQAIGQCQIKRSTFCRPEPERSPSAKPKSSSRLLEK